MNSFFNQSKANAECRTGQSEAMLILMMAVLAVAGYCYLEFYGPNANAPLLSVPGDNASSSASNEVSNSAVSSSLKQRNTHSTKNKESQTPIVPDANLPIKNGMSLLPAGAFDMGSETIKLADAKPVHRVQLDSFWLDIHPVTNAQFAQFIATTRYVTTAEQLGESAVFDRAQKKWRTVKGANWQHPEGPDSSIVAKDDFPVVQVSWIDANAYARWAGKRLPTEAEIEYAAKAGRTDAVYPWGPKELLDEKYQANYWQGRFPSVDLGYDKFQYLAPVGSFRPNRFGLQDMAGNVWCWSSDWYAENYFAAGSDKNPTGVSQGTDHVLRGGSWLSAKNFRFGIPSAARWHAAPDYRSNSISFRCAKGLY